MTAAVRDLRDECIATAGTMQYVRSSEGEDERCGAAVSEGPRHG